MPHHCPDQFTTLHNWHWQHIHKHTPPWACVPLVTPSTATQTLTGQTPTYENSGDVPHPQRLYLQQPMLFTNGGDRNGPPLPTPTIILPSLPRWYHRRMATRQRDFPHFCAHTQQWPPKHTLKPSPSISWAPLYNLHLSLWPTKQWSPKITQTNRHSHLTAQSQLSPATCIQGSH